MAFDRVVAVETNVAMRGESCVVSIGYHVRLTRNCLGQPMEHEPMSVNDQYDMSVFDGTPYEGLTYLQLRRRMTAAQVAKFKMLGKRTRRVARTQAADRQFARTYRK